MRTPWPAVAGVLAADHPDTCSPPKASPSTRASWMSMSGRAKSARTPLRAVAGCWAVTGVLVHYAARPDLPPNRPDKPRRSTADPQNRHTGTVSGTLHPQLTS